VKNAVYLVLSVLAVGAAAQTADPVLIDFELTDQFEQIHRDDDWRGDVLLLIGSDRNGSQFSAVWEQAVRENTTGFADMGSLRIVHVADVSGVPFFLKGVVRRKFPGDAGNPIILDWKGAFATAYGFDKDKANMLVFDRNAGLRHQVAAAEIDSRKLAELIDVLIALSGRHNANVEAD
jgi:hypothetical protein